MSNPSYLVSIVREAQRRLDALTEERVRETLAHIDALPYSDRAPLGLKVDESARTTCAKGCAHCCRLLTSIGYPEAVSLAVAFLALPDWRERVPALRRAAIADSARGLTNASRFRAQVPCGLLDEATQSCTVYAERPGVCRHHVALTPPERCAVDAPRDYNGQAGVATVPLNDIESAMWSLNLDLATVGGWSPYEHAPISLFVLYCLGVILDEGTPDYALAVQAIEGLRTPEQWIGDHAASLAREEDETIANDKTGVARAQRDDLVQIVNHVFRKDGAP